MIYFIAYEKPDSSPTTTNTIRPITTQAYAPLVPTNTTNTAAYLAIAVNISVLLVRNAKPIASANSTVATSHNQTLRAAAANSADKPRQPV